MGFRDKIYETLSSSKKTDGRVIYNGSKEDLNKLLDSNPQKVYNILSTEKNSNGLALYGKSYDDFIKSLNSDYKDLSLSANIENVKDSTKTITDSLDVKPITMSTTGNIQDVFNASLNDPVAQTKVRAQAIWDNIDKYDDDYLTNLDDDTYKALVSIANNEENKYIAQKKEKLRANVSMGNSGVPLYQQEMALDQMVEQDLINSPYPKKDRLEKLKRGYGERFEPLVAASVANAKERINNLGWTTKTETTPWGGGSTQVYVVDKDGKRVSEEQSAYMGHTYDLIAETEKLLSAPSKYDASNGFKNFAKGIADATTEAEFWLPFAGLAENMGVAKVAKKLNRNEELTTVEEALLESYINYGLAQEARQFNLSTGYKVGQGSAESIKFMLEMAIGGNITSSAGKAFVNKLAKKSLGKVGKAVVKFANSTSKAANFGKSALSTFVDPMFMASTWVNMSKEYADTHVHGDQDFTFVDMTSSYMDTVKEGATEKIGGILPTPSFLKDMYKFIPSYLKPFNGLMQNPLSEIGEEYMGSLFDIVRSWNPLLNEERQAELSAGAKSMWTLEGLKETSLMVAPLSILFGSANAGKMFKVNRAYSKSKQALLAELSKERYGLSQDDAKKVILKFDEAKTQEEKIKVAEKLHKAMYDSFIRENPTATQQERQMFADNVNKLLMHYANSNALYNQDIDDLSERYNKLSDKQKEKVDEALAKFTEQYVKVKQNEAFAQLEQQEAEDVVADEQAEALLQETIQEAEDVVADEQQPSLQAYDNEYGFFVKKKGDVMSVTDKSGHVLQFKDKSIADKEAKRLNGNYNGEYNFEVTQTMDGIVPQFAVVGKKKQPTPPPVAKMYDEKNGYGLTQKGETVNVTDSEGKAIQFIDRATADKEVKRLNENYKGDLVFEVRQTMDGVLPKFTVVGSKKQQLPESTQLYDEKNGYYLTSNGDVMRITDEKGRNFKFVDKTVAEREVKRLNNNFNGKYTFEIKQSMNGMIPQFTVLGRKKTTTATTTKPKVEKASKTTTTPTIEENKIEEGKVTTEGEVNKPEGEEIRRNPLVYYRGKQHELLSSTTEDGSIIVEDNLVRIREVGKDRTKAVRPENVYNDANYSEVAKIYPPKSNAEKTRKVNPHDYKNTDVNANDVADAFLREYGVEDTIEALQEMYSEALEKTQSAKGLAKADAKKELRRLEEVANTISEKTNVVVNLQNNTVEEVVEDTEEVIGEKVQTNEENTTEEVVEEPQMDVNEVVTDSNPVEVTETETTEEVQKNEDNANETPTTEETGVVIKQEPSVKAEETKQTTTPVEETTVEQRKRRTKSEKEIDLDDFISNVNITYKGEKTTLDKFLEDVLYESTINLSDKVMREVDSILSNLNEETSYEEAYEICANIENILAKHGLKLSKENQKLLYNNIYGPCENADATIKRKFPRPTTEEANTIGRKVSENKNKSTNERIILEGEVPTQEYVDSLSPEVFDNVLIFESQNSKLGISRRGYPVHIVNDRYFVLIDQTGKKQLIDRNQLGDKDYKKEGIKGTIVYLKGEDGNADLSKPYLAQTEEGTIKYGSVNIYPLFENDTKKVKNSSVDNLFVKTENGVDYYSQSDKQIKEDKVKKAIDSFNKEEGSPIDKFISFVDRYIQAFDEKRQAAVAKLGSYDTEFTGVGNFQSLEADSDLIATINDYIDRINGIAKEHGFIEIKHLPNMLGEKIDYHLDLLEFYSKHPTDKEAIKEYIINKNKLNDIKNTPEFKNKSTEEQLKYVEKVIDKVNNELGLFGIDKIKKSENKVVKALKKISSKTKGKKAEVKEEQTEQAEVTQSDVSNKDSIMPEQEYINYLMEKRGLDEETARSVYEWRKEQGTLGDMREMFDTNEYWYQEEARRFSDMMNLLMGGNKPLQLVSAKTIDRMLAYNRPVAVTSKNIGILKDWLGGIDIELVKPTDRGRASVDVSLGWYDISRKKAVIVEGAPIDVVIHEIGWHATFDWARKHNKKMYDQMVDYATNAPLEVKEYVQGEYGKLSEDEFIDEVGAKMFTDMARGKIYQKLRSQEARTWWEKVVNLFKELWSKAMLKIFRKPIKDKAIDFEKMKGMEPADAMSYIAQQMIDGKVLGEFYDYKLKSSNESTAVVVTKIKETPISERSGAGSGNSSSNRLLMAGSEHLSHNALAQPKDIAKLQNNSKTTKNSARKKINAGGFNGLNYPGGAVRELAKILKLRKSSSSMSYYGDFYEGDFVSNGKTLRLRISTHPANGERIGNANADDKISIVIYKNGEHISKGEHNGYIEYIYNPKDISLDNAANAILDGVISLIEKGEYIDNTGKAEITTYPYKDKDGNIRYMRASNGSIYGINTGYGMFVNIKPETKIGDCADLWLEQLRERNPNAYNLLFKLSNKNNHLSDDDILMSLLRIKLQNWGHKDVSSISDSDLRNMTFEELMDIMPSLEEIGSMDAVQESLDKTYEILHAQNVLFGGKFEEFWAQAMDDGLPLQRMMEALNAWRMTQGLDPLPDEYDVVNLRNYAASKSRTAIKEFRLSDEATALTDTLKKFRNTIENSDELKALMERTVVVKDVNWALRGLKKYKEREIQQLIESYLLAKDLQERRDMGLPTRGIDAFKKEHTMSIDEFVAEFEKNFTEKEIEDLWKKIKDVTKISLDYATKYGIITQELKDTYLKRDYYVPQRGFADEGLEDQVRNQRTTSKGKAKITQKSEGGKTLAADPLAHIFEVTDDTIKKAYRNEYLHKVHELLSMEENKAFFGKAAVSGVYVIENIKNGNGEIVKSMIPIDDMNEEFVKEDEQTREAIKLAQEELKKMSKVLAAGSPTLQALEQTIKTLENSIHYERSGAFISDKGKQNGNVVSFFYNGNYVQLEFADQRIADCLNDVHQHSDLQLEKIKKLNAYLSRIYTTYNPVFGIKNIIRDWQQISAIGGSKYGPKFVAELQKNAFSGLPDLVDIARYLEMPFADFKEISPEFMEFMRSGAMTGFVYSNTIDDYKDQVRKAISDENSTTFNEIWDGAVKSLGFITEAGEIFMRYQAFKTAKQMGMSTHKATEVAKNCGVNFDKKGAGFKEGPGKLINYVYDNISFSRAQMRGLAPMYEIMGIDKSKAQRKRLLTVLGTYVMIGFTSGLIQGFGDDEDETRNKAIRDEIPRELAQSNLFYKFEWSFEKANDFLNWIIPNSIPISQNFIPFYGLGYSLSQIALNHWREFENKHKGPDEKKYAVIDHNIMYQRMAMDFGVNAWMNVCPLPSAITDGIRWGARAIGTAAKAEDWEQFGREAVMATSSLMPTAVAPLFQALNNVDHLGRDIAHMPKFKNKTEYSDFYALRDLAAYLDGGHQEKHFFEDDKINPSKNYEYYLVFTKHLIDGYLPSFVGQGIEFADKYIGENYLGYVPDESTPKDKYNKIVGITARNAVNDFIKGYDNAMRELTNTKSARDYTPNMNNVIEKEARLETMKPAVTLAKQVIEELNKYDVEKKKQGKEFIKDYRKVTLQDYPEQVVDEAMYKIYTELLKTTYFMLLEQGYVELEK